MLEYIPTALPTMALIGLGVIVIKHNAAATKRLEQFKYENEEKYVRQDMCAVVSTGVKEALEEIKADVKESKADIKKVLENGTKP